MHEFEMLLFVAPQRFSEWADDTTVVPRLTRMLEADGPPEDINDAPRTAPSKRILSVMRAYPKTVHGSLIAGAIGLTALRAASAA